MQTPLQLLLLEDDPLDAELTIDTLLQSGIALDWVRVADQDGYCAELARHPHVILADYSLPGFDGLTALELARKHCPEVPFIFVSGALGEERAIDILTRGATDYVLKHRLERLVPAVQRAVREVEDRAERQRLEAALRTSEEAYRTLAEAIPAIVWVSAPDGAIEYYNRGWYDYTGRSPEESLGWEWRSTIHPEDLETAEAGWPQVASSGLPYQNECRLRSASGEYRWFLVRGIAQRDATGSIVRWFGTCTDIDHQKRAIEAMALADERKNEFLAMLAHELRNPLAPILNAAHLIQGAPELPPGVERAREVIERQARHMSRLLEDLLDLSRITRGKILMRRERIDLAKVVSETVEDHRPAFEQAGLHLEAQLAVGMPVVEGDPTRIAQIVGNLLNNALKFTPSGGKVTVSLKANGPKQWAKIVVRDTGSGVCPEMLPHIFEPFRQERRNLTPNNSGLGLGLALVRGLVELHGGQVEARSDGAGRGTEFAIRLPLARGSVQVAQPAVKNGGPPIARLRVLVVDDNRDAADTLREILEMHEHDVRVAYSGISGLETARAFRPEVVLCDIGLPEIDGFAVARALRQDPATRAACLIAVTGYGQEEDRRKSDEAGFNWHLTKPVDPSDLEELLGGPSVRVAP